MESNIQGAEKSSNAHDMVMKLLQNPSIIKDNVQKLIDEEKALYSNSINEAKELYDYVLSNWKKIVPPLAAIGLSVLLSQIQGKAQETVAMNNKPESHLN